MTTDPKKPEKPEVEGTFNFLPYHLPVLPDGDYTISVEQMVDIPGRSIPEKDLIFKTTRRFSVLGPRFNLDPQEVHAVFPPAGSLGEHSNVLPHIVLKRSTLPWERFADLTDKEKKEEEPAPWLALLLFDADEIGEGKLVEVSTLTLGTLKEAVGGGKSGLNLKKERGDHDEDILTLLTVERSLLKEILPTKSELALLTHVRESTDENSHTDEKAVIICNRLPQKDRQSIVHLVSLESRYDGGSFNYPPTEEKKISLVSLYSWRFNCLEENQNFQMLLCNLDRGTISHKKQLAQLNENRSQLSENENRSQLSETVRSTAENYLKYGSVLLSHTMRQGNRSISWYHGPLIGGENNMLDEKLPELPIRSADQLVQYDKDTGMFDISYAAAWELGRLLILQNKKVSIDLFNWKRVHAHDEKLRTAESDLAHLPFTVLPLSLELPESVRSWFADLECLKGIPFNYLVPDQGLLPPDSIRFFQVDWLWLECLLDGAFSIGRVSENHCETDRQLKSKVKKQSKLPGSEEIEHLARPQQKVSGFLLRSDVVAGWPDLLVDGRGIEAGSSNELQPLGLWRIDRLSKNVLLCLFTGEIRQVDIHQKPEAVHFGFSRLNGNFTKNFKSLQGTKDEKSESVPVAWKNNYPNLRVVNIEELAKGFGLNSSAAEQSGTFALQLTEGVQAVRFFIS